MERQHLHLNLLAVGILSYWALLAPEVTGLIAYDCGDANVNISAISLKTVARCPDPSSAYESESVVVTVIQRNEIGLQHVWSCLVEVTRLITHCGMHSHSSMVAGGLSNYIHQVGAEECKQIHRYRTLKIHQRTIGGVILNGTTTASVTLFGAVDNTGKCNGISYQENGRSWDDVIVTATVKIQVNDYYALAKLKDNEISLKGGIVCPFLKGYCFDSTIGESTWDYQAQPTCEGHFSLLYEGKAERVTNIHTKEQYIVVNEDSKLFAVTLIKKVQICGVEIWQSEHPKLLICEGHIRTVIGSAVLLPQNTDLTLYINSKFLYVEQSYKRALESLYIDTIHRRCLIQREMLKNRLLLAPVVPDAVSQIIQNGEGYIGHVLGEVLYILKCVPKQVQIRRSERCYQELPVRVDNQSKFMAPITRILQNYGEEIECNGLTPPLYNIDGDWLGLSPYPTQRQAPKELEVSTYPLIEFQPIQSIGSKGLYTQEEINRVQRLTTFGQERKVVENIIARRVAGMDTGAQGFSTLGIFDVDEMKELAHSTLKQMWGWFSDLGVFMSGMIGFYFIFRIVKYTCGVIINGFHLYQTVGGGIALLACLWNTLAMWVIHRYHVKNKKDATDKQERADLGDVAGDADGARVNDRRVTEGQSVRIYPNVPGAHWTDIDNKLAGTV